MKLLKDLHDAVDKLFVHILNDLATHDIVSSARTRLGISVVLSDRFERVPCHLWVADAHGVTDEFTHLLQGVFFWQAQELQNLRQPEDPEPLGHVLSHTFGH